MLNQFLPSHAGTVKEGHSQARRLENKSTLGGEVLLYPGVSSLAVRDFVNSYFPCTTTVIVHRAGGGQAAGEWGVYSAPCPAPVSICPGLQVLAPSGLD